MAKKYPFGRNSVTITYEGTRLEVEGNWHEGTKGSFRFGAGGTPDEAGAFEVLRVKIEPEGEDITKTLTYDDLEEIAILAGEKYN